MIKPQRSVSRGQKSNIKSSPAPVKGWNARDSLAAMNPQCAVKLENWFPRPSECIARYGSINWATGFTSPVNTIMSYNGATTKKLFAASGNSIYDITASGAIGTASVTGLSESKLQFVQYSTAGGFYLYWVNGANAPQYFDGSSWTTPAITGTTASNFIHVNIFKTRLFFIEKNTLNAWYLPAASIAGAANKLDFGSIFRRGGHLVSMGTWSLDAGYGLDDYAAWITSEGEVAVYRGTDPSSSTTWGLIGVYQIGTPMGNRCFAKYGGDLLLITKDGLQTLSNALNSSRVNTKTNLTDVIQWAISSATSNYANNFGWQIQLYPPENMLILNIPVSQGLQEQYVMNTVTGAWCKFTGWPAYCWELYNDNIYYGSDTTVVKAWYGRNDNGSVIRTDGISAFDYFGGAAQLKQFKMVRPVLQTDGAPSIQVGINTNLSQLGTLTAVSTAPSIYGIWDSSLWDASLWRGDQIIDSWRTISGLGYSAAIRIASSTQDCDLHWLATDFVFERGGVI